jgi:hypothetical protein
LQTESLWYSGTFDKWYYDDMVTTENQVKLTLHTLMAEIFTSSCNDALLLGELVGSFIENIPTSLKIACWDRDLEDDIQREGQRGP